MNDTAQVAQFLASCPVLTTTQCPMCRHWDAVLLQLQSSSCPPSPGATHNLMRCSTMSDRALLTRIRRISNLEKLASFVRVLEALGKADLAAEARAALNQLTSGGGSSSSKGPTVDP